MKLALDLLKPDPSNARKIADAALDGLAVSAETFGDLSGITWNEQLGLLVAGHQRMKVLRAAGATEWVREGANAYIVHPKTKERFRIRIVNWDATTHRMAELTANNPHIQGDYDDEMVTAQLAELEHNDAFAALRLAELESEINDDLAAAMTPAAGNADPDHVPEPPPIPITKRGDLWLLGDHRLLCGDSTSPEDVQRLLGSDRAQLVATDPPYGVDYTATKAGMPISGLGNAQERWGDIENDDLKGDGLRAFLDKVLAAAMPICAERPAFYVWHPSGALSGVFRDSMVAAGILIHRLLIWKKAGFVMTRSGMYHWAHETCFYGWRQGSVPPWYGEKNQTSVWELSHDEGKAVHPTQKPVAIFEIPMANHTRPGEVCYEPFSGSGSQIIAGQRLGRKVCAMELSPRYCDVAVTRWEGFTGKKAVLSSADPG